MAAKPSTTRRAMAPFFSILVTTTAPISAVLATCVPPQGCRSIGSSAPMRMVRTAPVPRGGETDMLLTRAGLASSSASAISPTLTGSAAPTRRAMPAFSASLSSAWSVWKSSRAASAVIEQPFTGWATRWHSRCVVVWKRMSRCRRSQSISAVTGVPTVHDASRSCCPGAGTWQTAAVGRPSASLPLRVSAIARRWPSASTSQPVSPAWPPPSG
ncbi:MAG: hypothetical protein QM811_11480 [Pirellulales bacterium]